MKCLIDVEHDECYEEIFCGIRKSRKHRECSECQAPILKGEEHEVFVGAIDGGIDTHRTCLTCVSVRQKFCCGWTYTGMYDDIHEAIDFDPALENCILMECSKEQYVKLTQLISIFGKDEDE